MPPMKSAHAADLLVHRRRTHTTKKKLYTAKTVSARLIAAVVTQRPWVLDQNDR